MIIKKMEKYVRIGKILIEKSIIITRSPEMLLIKRK